MMTTSLKQSKAYWDNRVKAEKVWQESAKKDMEKYNQHIVDMYNQTISDINQQIKADLALSEGKLVKADAMKEYESLAKRAVDKANALRAKGKHVTRKDFSEDVNNRLKVYNATMRINRNEIIKSKIGARLVELGVDQEESLTNKLWNDYIKEKERQAGILGITTKSNLWTSKEVQAQIAGQIAGANFSKRIWADIDGLKGQLDGLVSSAVIRGESPQEMAKWLTGMVSSTVSNQKYAAERLARTETARVQFEAQKKSIIDTGYKYVKWIAEGSACKVCREIAYKDNGYDEDGVYKAKDVPDIPVHPNCMCSISAHWVDDDKLPKEPKNEDKDLQTIIDGLQSSNFISTYGNKIANELAKKINTLMPEQKKMYIKNLKNITFREPSSGGANVVDKVVEISKKDLLGTKTENKFGIFFHETGHAFDVPKPLEKGKMPSLEDVLNPSQKVGLAESTLKDFNNDVYKDIPNFDSLGKRPRRNSKAYKTWNENYMALMDKRSKAEDAFDGEIDKLKKLSPLSRSNLSDMIESADSRLGDYKWSSNPLGMGHAQKNYGYWKDKDIGNAESEFFAEVNSAVATNPESLELIKKYFPISYKKYWEVVKLINK